MSANSDGFHADPEDLRGGASDIRKCLEPAKGIDFGDLNDSFGESDQGDLLLAGKFEKFCDTWDVAHVKLEDSSEDSADKLEAMAQNYEQADAFAEGRLMPPGMGPLGVGQ
ncbi:hypothetical protein ACFU7T_29955 [Streptomyces sp. NPDC057555]|uniref:hypothetical protein n=1 Tax=Streptomyces sp. NPDC057555 TaxID=3346166 RepID=UPI003677C283